MNIVILHGNLGADPEVKQLNGGNAVCNLRVATSRRVKVGEEWQDKTDWHRVVVWGKRGEAVGKHLTKGSKVAIQGRIETRTVDREDGTKQYFTDIVADEVEFGTAKTTGAVETPAPVDTSKVPF